MATQLSTFASAVLAKLVAAGITDVESLVGRKHLTFHKQKRRIVWVSPGGKLTPPKQAGGRPSSSDATKRVVACKTNEATVRVYIFGGTDEATEELFEAVVAAACEAGGAHIEMPSYDWVTEDEQHAGNANRTDLILLTMTLRESISAEIATLTPIGGIDDVCGTLGGTESVWTVTPQG